MLRERSRRGKKAGLIAGIAALLAALLLAPWWRNYAMLRDFYDYGLVMAAVGRMEAGERPYVDFATPIQTLHFLLAQGAERIWGARYLSLTYANAAAMVVALAGFALLLRRYVGAAVALLVGAAVVIGSFGQHTIVWHNAMGVAWLAVATWSAARIGKGDARTVGLSVAMFAALWLGGMTKVTYQVAGLAFVLLFMLRAVVRGTMTARRGVAMGVAVVGFGIVAPVLTEMAYTGASFAVWRENVFELAASRRELLLRALSPEFYWRTPHDYYAGANFPFVGGWGVLLVGAVGWVLWRRRNGAERAGAEKVFLMLGVMGALVCGAVLLATNFEIAQMSGAAWLVLATALGLAFARQREGRWILAAGAVTLAVPAWWSAWTGARVLWGRETLVRESFVSADELPARFSYLRGTRVESTMRDSLRGFDEYMQQRTERRVYFALGTEWMVRVAPEARHRGLPLWLHDGTTYSDENAWILNARLAPGGGIETVVTFEAWNHWHFGAAEMLQRAWSGPSRVGPHLMVYEIRPRMERPLAHPVELATATDSNVYARRVRAPGIELALQIRKDGAYLAQPSGSAVTLDFPVETLRGEMVAELTEPVAKPVTVAFRVKEGGGEGSVLAEWRVELSNEMSSRIGSFEVEGGGRAVVLEVEANAANARVGWRKLWTRGAEGDGEDVPGPLDEELKTLTPRGNWVEALMASETKWAPLQTAVFGIDAFADTRNREWELFAHVPGEVWLRVDPEAERVSGEFGLREHAWTHADSLPGAVARVVWVKSGRLEVLFEKELRPIGREEDRALQRFEVALPEEGGWVGLVWVSTDVQRNAWGHAWWRRVRID